jgi:hypothetical protein
MTPSDDEIVETMITHGGSFVSQLGKAWRLADVVNRHKLRDAFPEYWESYRELAALKVASER